MSKQNKVITTIQQDFTDAEKAQARANIGAVVKSYYNASVFGHTITQTEAQNGYFTILYNNTSQRFDTLLMCMIELVIGANTGLSNNVLPVVVRIKLTDSNNVEHTDTVSTGVLCRTSNSSDWRYVAPFFFDFSRLRQYTFTSMKIEVDTGPYIIPQNTDITISIQRDVIYYG